ncbi:tetratricopeptide repeat protein [Gloeobacter morelensis]|uniref:Tetratricopeptide repeat protein n=1 Tax=Gloeobacter morelensis MG652769 TaxID=2781736 RepID=A0ABY3PI72_9CYAN|nr:tetratricopeptide repeat protein [Gloeobacter morelensis]UFP93321.1 tetratricopeptide repeat protein [Gloeobacter morelensis MG652769]
MKLSLPLGIALAALLSASSPPSGLLAQSAPLQARFKEAYTLQQSKDYSRARQVWDQLLKEYPNEAAAYVNRALTRYYLNDPRGAVADLTLAIEKKADYADAYYNRAAILNALKDYEPALQDYEKYVTLVPKEQDTSQVSKIVEDLKKKVAVAPPAPPPTVARAAAPDTPPPTASAAAESKPAPPTPAPPPPAAPAPATAAETETATNAAAPLEASSAPTELPPGVYSLGRIAGYDATTEDLLLGLKLSVDRKLLKPTDTVYQQAQNLVVQMKRGATVDQAARRSGLGKQSMIRLAWRGAAWRSYRVFIK